MSLGISTFHFTKWVALHLAELKSNHRIKIEKNHDISDTLVVKGGGDPFTTYTWKRTVTTSLIHSDQWSVHILQKKNKWQVKWSFLHLKNEKSTNSKSYPWQLSSPIISCYFWNLRLWKILLMKVLSNEKGIFWGRKRTFTIVHDLEKCYVDSCTEVPFPIRTWSTEFNLVKNF